MFAVVGSQLGQGRVNWTLSSYTITNNKQHLAAIYIIDTAMTAPFFLKVTTCFELRTLSCKYLPFEWKLCLYFRFDQ